MKSVPVPTTPRFPHFAAEELVGDPGTRPLTHAVIMLISALVAAFLIWAAITPVQELAATQGEIVPAGAIQSIEHLEGGIVEEILVKEGQIVDKGQPLLRLSGNSANSSRDQLLTRRDSLALQIERLRAFATDRAPDFESLSTDQALIREQAALLAAQLEGRRQQEQIFTDQIANLSAQIATSIRRRDTLDAVMKLIGGKVNIRQELVSQGLNSELQLLDARRELAAALSERQQIEASLSTMTSTIVETRSRIAELHTRLRQEALDKLGTASAERAEVGKQIMAQDDRVDRLVIAAPVHGIVQEIAVKTIGGVVQPAALVAKLVPLNDDLIAEIQISPRDIGFVHAGQPVKVKVQAFDYARYGRIDGAMIGISPTTFINQEKIPYYLGRVKLATAYVGKESARHLVVPGMTVQADVVTGEKTLLQYLLKPIYTTLEGTFGER